MATTRDNANRRTRPGIVRLAIVQDPSAAATQLLERALESAGFWPDLARQRRAHKPGEGPFTVLIKPDLDVYGACATSDTVSTATVDGTDPVLVEHLIDLLHDKGYPEVVVGAGCNSVDHWLHNRDPLILADLAGYRFSTSNGRGYEVVDLAADEHWLRADYRVNFAKNRTHEADCFALCLRNLIGAARRPASGAAAERAAQRAFDMMRHAPPHFNLIDAAVSLHGGAGERAPQPLRTCTMFACSHLLLADWAAAARMGLDPYASPLNATALRELGLPPRYEIDGDQAPYPQWRNVHPMIARGARTRNTAGELGALTHAWFQTVDRERFAPVDFHTDRINSFVAPLMARIDEQPRAFWLIVALDQLLARIDGALGAQRMLFAKDRLVRSRAGLTIDPARYSDAEYDEIAATLVAGEQLLRGCPTNRAGLRWRHLDSSIVFGGSHLFALPFDAFVEAVDITRSIQYMNDYIGGSTLPVSRDRQGRIVRQAERNLYLQQPNWTVLFGGEPIDVEKLESIRYERNRHTICWRTVHSTNASASVDDGRVSFVRDESGGTRVEIFAQQRFAVPVFFRLFDIDLAPSVRDPIIDAAYTTYFNGTIANMQAAFDGREFRIGRDATDPDETGRARDGGDLARYLATAAAALAELLRHRGDTSELLQWLFPADPVASAEALPGHRTPVAVADEHGFRHFPGPSARALEASDPARTFDASRTVAGIAALMRDAPELLGGLADAMSRDLDALAESGAPRMGR
jgi:uncharacterized protein (DUF362 family)